jgi:hypothetical protein
LSPRDAWSPGAIDLPPICKHLSSDYLDQYLEVLQLIEAAPRDEAAADALLVWQAKSYRVHYARSGPLPISAYEALPGMRRHVFEKLIAEMDMLIEMACFALQWPCDLDLALPVAEITVSGLRGMIRRAAAFLDSGGRDLGHPADSDTAESILDRIRAVGRPPPGPVEQPPEDAGIADEAGDAGSRRRRACAPMSGVRRFCCSPRRRFSTGSAWPKAAIPWLGKPWPG